MSDRAARVEALAKSAQRLLNESVQHAEGLLEATGLEVAALREDPHADPETLREALHRHGRAIDVAAEVAGAAIEVQARGRQIEARRGALDDMEAAVGPPRRLAAPASAPLRPATRMPARRPGRPSGGGLSEARIRAAYAALEQDLRNRRPTQAELAGKLDDERGLNDDGVSLRTLQRALDRHRIPWPID